MLNLLTRRGLQAAGRQVGWESALATQRGLRVVVVEPLSELPLASIRSAAQPPPHQVARASRHNPAYSFLAERTSAPTQRDGCASLAPAPLLIWPGADRRPPTGHHIGWAHLLHSLSVRRQREGEAGQGDVATSTPAAGTSTREVSTSAQASDGLEFEKVVNLANGISFARMLSAPLLYHWIVSGQLEYALVGLFLAGVSDWADGYVAKTYKFSSTFGSYLDPLADKACIIGVSLGVWQAELLPWWVLAVVIGRDAVLTVGAFAHRAHVQGWKWKGWRSYFKVEGSGGAPLVKPLFISKVNTCLQFSLLGFALTSPYVGFPSREVLEAMCYVVSATTVASGGAYVHGYLNGTVLPVQDGPRS